MVNVSLALLSAVLIGTGVHIPLLWFSTFLAFIPAGLLVERLKTYSKREAFLYGWFLGSLLCGALIFGTWGTLPLDWLGEHNPIKGFLIVLMYWAGMSVFEGFFIGACVVTFNTLRTRRHSDALLLASLWVVLQYAGLWGFSLLMYGDSSLSGPHFSPFMIGYGLAWSPSLLSLAPLGGIYILCFVAVLFGYGLYQVSCSPSLKIRVYAVVCIGILFAMSILDASRPTPSPSGDIRVALVTTNFPAADITPRERIVRAETIASLIDSWTAGGGSADLVVLPEGAELFKITKKDPRGLSKQIATTTSVTIIDSDAAALKNSRVVRLYAYQDGIIKGTYDKTFLVPQGEYSPWLFGLIPRIIGGKSLAQRISNINSLSRGNGVQTIPTSNMSLGALFCAEILSPRLYAETVRQGADVLVNSSSDSLFHQSRLIDTYVLAIAKVRAAEVHRALVIASNFNPSTIIAENGALVARSHPAEESILTGSISRSTVLTPYARYGDLVLFIPCIFIGAFIVFRRKRNQISTP